MTDDMTTKSGVARYSAAALSVTAGLALRAALVQVFGPTIPYITFFPAVMFSAWFGGFGPGLFSAVLTIAIAFSALGSIFRDSRRFTSADVIGAVAFLAVSAFISFFTDELRQSRARSNERLRQLQAEMKLRSESESQLRHVNQALATANRQLEEFAYISTHDVREPLRMIHIHAELLREEIGSGNERVREHFDHLRDSVGKMEVLIRDLLHYSRTVHGEGLPIGDASLDLSLHEALAVLQYEIAESGAIVTAETLPAVKGDGSQLSHVFQNLISNAIKYRRAGSVPQITIGALRKEQHWIISVGDNGIGFEPQYAERIFGLFKRLHRDAYPGTGLGLAICQRIIERHGGRIWATSTAGQGSIFSFSLLAVERADESGTNA